MSTPSWITGLSDATLKADFTTFSSAGALTEVEMTKALTDLSAALKSSNKTLSASQLTDLKTIAANIGSMSASPYLQYIVHAFDNGNAANAVWTGGGASTTALGNLAAGYSVTQLNELIGKWFLGTDLPISTVNLTGQAAFTVTYSLSTSPLYGSSGGPLITDVNQGKLADCYLLGSLAEVASQDPSIIKSMITSNGNGTYGVRFFVNGVAEYVTVDAALANGGKTFNSGPAIWASLIETAYAEVQASGVITGNSVNSGNSFSTIGNAGAAEMALEEITGASAITDFAANGTTWNQVVYNQSFTSGALTSGLTTASVLSVLAADLLVGDDLVLGSQTAATDTSGKTTLVANHTMSVYGYDSATSLLEIRNPWGGVNGATGQTWDTTFEISLATLLTDADTLTVDNAGTATTATGASVVAATGLQAMAQVKSFTVTDSVANVNAGLAGLIADAKMTSLTVNGTTAGDALTLTGLATAATIAMAGNSDAATVTGFKSTGTGVGTATSLNLGPSAYDRITLGSGSETIMYSIGASSGVESIANFSAAHDLLSISLGAASLLQTLVGGGDWISSSADMTHGVFLAGITTTQKVTMSGTTATVA